MYNFIQRVKRLIGYGAVGVVATVGMMNPDVLDLVKASEGGCTGTECVAYVDPVGVPTIGYGHTLMAGTMKFTLGDVWSEEFASKQLDVDMKQYWDAVDKAVTVDLNRCQLSVLSSWTYNVGQGAMRRSTLIRLLNQGQYDAVPAQLKRWNKGGGRVLRGLSIRRAKEGVMWTNNCEVN
jgi:lysozyme